jgi:rhodanese-related sulfurtransferase
VQPLQIPTISVEEIPANAFLLDVREPDEWNAGHAPEATHVPMGDIPAKYAADPEFFEGDRPLVVVCHAGGRSARVVAWLQQQGVPAINLAGGMADWAAAGRPLVNEIDGEPYV